MTPLQIIWTMLKDLLTIDYTLYNQNNIIDAYQNDYTLPQINDFIIIQQRNTHQNGLPLRDFDYLNQKKLLTGFNDFEYQIDLYGDSADLASTILYTYLNSSAASNYLNQYNMGIGRVYDAKNLSSPNDRDRYMKRYMILFTAMNIQTVQIPMQGVGLSDINIEYQEIL